MLKYGGVNGKKMQKGAGTVKRPASRGTTNPFWGEVRMSQWEEKPRGDIIVQLADRFWVRNFVERAKGAGSPERRKNQKKNLNRRKKKLKS